MSLQCLLRIYRQISSIQNQFLSKYFLNARSVAASEAAYEAPQHGAGARKCDAASGEVGWQLRNGKWSWERQTSETHDADTRPTRADQSLSFVQIYLNIFKNMYRYYPNEKFDLIFIFWI